MTRSIRIEDLDRLAVPETPTISPDGQDVAYVLREIDVDADRAVRRLWKVGAVDGTASPLTSGPADAAPSWSPDGAGIAFLRTDDDGHPQVWIADVATDRARTPTRLPGSAGARQLTRMPLGAGAPIWSPDGSHVAFSALTDARDRDESDAARIRREHAPIVIDRLDYKRDGLGLYDTRRSHLFVTDVGGGPARQVTTGDWHAGDPAWSPDGQHLAFAARLDPDGDLTLRRPVWIVDLAVAGATSRLVGLADGVADTVCFTADGQALLVLGHSGTPHGHQHLLRVEIADGAVTDLSAALDRNTMAGGPAYPGGRPQLVNGGDTVLFCARDRAVTHLFAVDVGGGRPRLVLGGDDRVVNGLSAAAGRVATVLATQQSYGEVVVADLTSGEESVRTAHGAGLEDARPLPRLPRRFMISDGGEVAGWIVADPEGSWPRPMLLDVHGGPHNAWNAVADEMRLYHDDLAARGWIVLLLNPRGSDGYGESFFTAITGQWGAAETADLLEPIDQLVAEGFADPERLAIAGYSYGGFMTCYLTGRDDRFAAAVTGGVVSDLVSMVGTCDDAHLFSELELGGQWWRERERYLGMSPMTRVDEVRTPTLVLHGADDSTCPVGQAEQWFTALRERGVPTRMVLYPGAPHAFILTGPPSQRKDFGARIVDWVQRYVCDTSDVVRS